MSTSTRWTIAVLVVVVALGVALWTQLRRRHIARPGRSRLGRPAITATPTPRKRWRARAQRADLPPCPAAGTGARPEQLRGIIRRMRRRRLGCRRRPRRWPADRWSSTCGRTGVRRARTNCPRWPSTSAGSGPTSTVVTVHQDENEPAALLRLAELGVRLPTLQDGRSVWSRPRCGAQRDARDSGAARGR